MHSPHQDVIERYFAALSAADRDAWLACFAPEGEAEDPCGSPPKRGHGELGVFFDGVAGLMARMDFRPRASHHCGDRAAVAWSALLEANNGKVTACDGIDLFEFDPAGRIRKITGYWEPAAVFASLGLG